MVNDGNKESDGLSEQVWFKSGHGLGCPAVMKEVKGQVSVSVVAASAQ